MTSDEKLGALLLADGAIDREQLLAGLREQLLRGGRLGSVLLALGHLGEDALCRALAEQSGVAAVTAGELEASTDEARARLHEDTARRERAFPLAVDGGRLRCAMADPRDARALAALEQDAGMPIDPRIAPEALLLACFARHHAPLAEHAPTEAGAVHGARPATRRTRPIRLGPGALAPPRLRPQPISAFDGQRLLDSATRRDQIGEAMVIFSRGRLDSSILFTVRGDRVVGWKGQGPGIDGETLEQIVLPVDAGRFLEDPARHRRTFQGRPRLPDALAPLSAMQGPKGEIVAIPGVAEDQVVTILIGTTHQVAEEAKVRALERHAAAAGEAYARILAALEP